MTKPSDFAFALLLGAPGALLAHPGHAPGEPEHWVIAALFAALSLVAMIVWRARSPANTRARRPRKNGQG